MSKKETIHFEAPWSEDLMPRVIDWDYYRIQRFASGTPVIACISDESTSSSWAKTLKITPHTAKVTCGNCKKTKAFKYYQEQAETDKTWQHCKLNSDSFELIDAEDDKFCLQMTTKPINPEETAVIVDTLLERIGEYLEEPRLEKIVEDETNPAKHTLPDAPST